MSSATFLCCSFTLPLDITYSRYRAFPDKLHNAAATEIKGGALLLGACTFFLPCGFTQTMHLYVLGKASFIVGTLTMLAVAVGTLPALPSLSTVSWLGSRTRADCSANGSRQ